MTNGARESGGDPEHDARIRADERAKVLAAVVSQTQKYPRDSGSWAFTWGWCIAEKILAGDLPDGDTALRDLLAREREAGYADLQEARDAYDKLAKQAAGWGRQFARLAAERDAARAQGAREALESAAAAVRRDGIGPRTEYLGQWLDDRAAAINPTTYADTLRAEAAASELEELFRHRMVYETAALNWRKGDIRDWLREYIDNRAAELRAKGAR